MSITYYREIQDFLQKELPTKGYFCCVYGSYPAKQNTSQSDIDLFVASELTSDDLFRKIEMFVLNLHKKHGLTQDEEVPYRNKLLVSYTDVMSAVTLKQFISPKKEEYAITKVEKTKEFLMSDNIRLRLIFNALTTPHDFISGDFAAYLKFRERAEKSLYELAKYLCHTPTHSVFALVDALMRSGTGEEGEMYLGYKNFDVVIEYLSYILSSQHEKLSS